MKSMDWDLDLNLQFPNFDNVFSWTLYTTSLEIFSLL
jgi:hypothetical protein